MSSMSSMKPMMLDDDAAAAATPVEATPATPVTPFAGLARELTTRGLSNACLGRRLVEREVKVARMLHSAGKAFGIESVESKEAGGAGGEQGDEWKDFEEVERNLKRAAETLESQASKSSCDVYTAKAKLDLAGRLGKLCEKTKEAAELRGLDAGRVDPDGLAQAEEDASELEATIRAEISAHYAAIVAGLEGRWGTRKAHKDIEAFVIKQQEPAMLGLQHVRDAPIFELGALGDVEPEAPEAAPEAAAGKKAKAKRTHGVKFVLPRSFNDKDNGAVGANAIFYTKEATDGAPWVPVAGSVVDKKCAVTVGRYRLLQAALRNSAEMKEYIRGLLLARVGAESPWYEALSKGVFDLVALCHEPEDATQGLAMCQLATAVRAESMTPALHRTMEQIAQNMTKDTTGTGPQGPEAPEAPEAPPRYFTIGMKRESTDDAHEQEEEQASKQRGLVIKKAVEVGMASGSARGLWDYSEEGGSASEDTCVAFFLEGDEAIYGTGGLEEQIKAKLRQHAEACAAAARGARGPHDREAREAREALVSAGDILHELAELEEKKGNLRTAMQEATRSVPAARVARALEMAMKRYSTTSDPEAPEDSEQPARKRSRCGSGL